MSDENPQMPTGVIPILFCNDVGAALQFYKNSLGWEEQMSMPGPDGQTIIHAMVGHGTNAIMLGHQDTAGHEPWKAGFAANHHGTGAQLYIMTENIDDYYNQVKNNPGTNIVMELEDQFWGDRIFSVLDNNGYYITFAEHVRDVSPEEMAEAMNQGMDKQWPPGGN